MSVRTPPGGNLSPGPSRSRSIRRSQRTSQRSDDTQRSDLSVSYSDPERFYDEGEMMSAAPSSNHVNRGSSRRSASAHHHVSVASTGGGDADLDLQSPTTPTAETPNNNNVNKSADEAAKAEQQQQPEKKQSAASRMVRGLGLRRSDRESQKSQKSNASAGSSDQSVVTTQPTSAPAAATGMPVFPNRAGASFRQISVPPHMRLHRVPEDGGGHHDWIPAHETYYYDDYGAAGSEDEEEDYSRKNVPIWLCLCVVVAYIVWGAFIFKEWENWEMLDSAYFCFITLTTIGFGDLVPNQQSEDGTTRIALCSLYLLFGIAMIAMSFNLVQEQVINNVKELGRQLGIIKDEDEDDEY